MAFNKAKKVEIKEDEVLVTRTYCYAIFSSSSQNFLSQRARNVNYVWNFLNKSAFEILDEKKYWLDKVDLQEMTAGTSKLTKDDFGFDFSLCSKTVQAIAHKYHDSRRANDVRGPKPILNFRNLNTHKGWIPFRPRAEDTKMPSKKNGFGFVRYNGKWIKFKAHRLFPENASFSNAEFTMDTKGRWEVHFTVKFPLKVKPKLGKSCGIDLNLSENKQVVLSDGTVFGRESLTKQKEKETNKVHLKIYKLKYTEAERELLAEKKRLTELCYADSSTASAEEKKEYKKKIREIRDVLKIAWKENKKLLSPKKLSMVQKELNGYYKRLRKIEYKFERKRHDFQHKASRIIADSYDEIYIGAALDNKFSQTKMAKSFKDLAPSEFRFNTKYKVLGNGFFIDDEVNEAGSTFSCSECLETEGPRGLEGLKIREWICPKCGKKHDRDVNSASCIEKIGKGEIVYIYELKRFTKTGVGSDSLEKAARPKAPRCPVF